MPLAYQSPTAIHGLLTNGRPLLLRPYLAHLRYVWWQSLLVWPPAVVGGYALYRTYLQSADLNFDPSDWFFVVAIGAVFVRMYLMITLGYERQQLFAQGIRVEQKQFAEWHALHHWSDDGKTIRIFLKANPAIPAAVFPHAHSGHLDGLRTYLQTWRVPRDDDASRGPYILLRASIVIASILFLLAGLWAVRNLPMPGLMFLVDFWLCTLSIVLLERYRGLPRLTRVKPATRELKLLLPGRRDRILATELQIIQPRGHVYGPVPSPLPDVLNLMDCFVAAYPHRPDVPPIPGTTMTLQNTLVDVITTTDSMSRRVLPVFTSSQALQEWLRYPAQMLPVQHILPMVMAINTHGIVINPAGENASTIDRESILLAPAADVAEVTDMALDVD